MGLRCARSIWCLHKNGFLIGAADVRNTLGLMWTVTRPAWIDQWSLTQDKLIVLNALVQEQLQEGHIVPSTSPWNSVCHQKEKWQVAFVTYGMLHVASGMI